MYSPKYLICVTQNNNNKYYKMIPNGSSGWIAEYGRVNSTATKFLIHILTGIKSIERSLEKDT